MTAHRASPPLLRITVAGTLPFAWLVLGWYGLTALPFGPNVDLAVASIFLVVLVAVILGASLFRRSRSRWPLVLTSVLLFVSLAGATCAGPSWIICGGPVDVPKRFVLSLAAGALAVAGYGLATAYLGSASARPGLGATVQGLVVAAVTSFLTIVLLLGLYGAFINPALSCAAPFPG